MCGFLFSCSLTGPSVPSATLLELLKRRGPDGLKTIHRTIQVETSPAEGQHQELHLCFSASVLSLRGKELVIQPLEDEDTGSLFLWNGEAWSFDGTSIHGNDATSIYERLLLSVKELYRNKSDHCNIQALSIDAIMKVIGVTRGPFSFLLYEPKLKRIFYGRDPLGRRSLLYGGRMPHELSISSVSDGWPLTTWAEVEADGIYMLNLDTGLDLCALHKTKDSDPPSGFTIHHIPWKNFTVGYTRTMRFSCKRSFLEIQLIPCLRTSIQSLIERLPHFLATLQLEFTHQL